MGGHDEITLTPEERRALVQIERRLAGQDLRAEGLVRVTTTDTLLASVLQAPLVTFQRKHPGITLDVTPGGGSSSRNFDLLVTARAT